MSCDNQYRHVCLKDLDNYIKRDTYFGDFSENEIKQIQKNLGIVTSDEKEYNPTLITGTYNEIHTQQQLGSLKIGYVYVITDFRSIYKDADNNICGTDNFLPSQEYWMFLTPVGTSSFSSRVSLLQTNGASTCQHWVVEYDINKNSCDEGKGTITYLKDTNNNSAYYDFKNIRFKKTALELSKGSVNYTNDTYLYTFDNNGSDNSEATCTNNQLGINATDNVFLGTTKNVILDNDCHDNIFFNGAENCHFSFGTYNNFFIQKAINCFGAVHNKELEDIINNSDTKHFEQLGQAQIVSYIDSSVLTQQIVQL